MSFRHHHYCSALRDNTKDPKPLLLFIPGIFGNGFELKDLYMTLNEFYYDKIRVGIFFDSDLQDIANIKATARTLTQEADSLHQALTDTFEIAPNASIFIIGYSAGCERAVALAQKLKDISNDITLELFLIDGPSPLLKKQYFESGAASLSVFLLEVTKYAIQLSFHTTLTNEAFSSLFREDVIKTLQPLDLNDQIDKITNSVMKPDNESFKINPSLDEQGLLTAKNKFQSLITMLKSELNTIQLHESEKKPFLSKIRALILPKTAETHQDKFAGWSEYAQEVDLITHDELSLENHRSLVEQKAQKMLATIVSHTIKKEWGIEKYDKETRRAHDRLDQQKMIDEITNKTFFKLYGLIKSYKPTDEQELTESEGVRLDQSIKKQIASILRNTARRIDPSSDELFSDSFSSGDSLGKLMDEEEKAAPTASSPEKERKIKRQRKSPRDKETSPREELKESNHLAPPSQKTSPKDIPSPIDNSSKTNTPKFGHRFFNKFAKNSKHKDTSPKSTHSKSPKNRPPKQRYQPPQNVGFPRRTPLGK